MVCAELVVCMRTSLVWDYAIDLGRQTWAWMRTGSYGERKVWEVREKFLAVKKGEVGKESSCYRERDAEGEDRVADIFSD